MNVIRSQLRDVNAEEVNTFALSANDDKRLIMENGISTLAYGHYNAPAAIENQEKQKTDHYSGRYKGSMAKIYPQIK